MQAQVSGTSASSDQHADPRRVVLVIDDAADPSAVVDRQLTLAGYAVEHATSGEQGRQTFDMVNPALVVLVLGLPQCRGLEVARRLRAQSGVPILMLASGDDIACRVAGLDAGADDYLSRPFAVEELLARVRALLRGRALAVSEAMADSRHGLLTYADVRLDQDTREAARGERRLALRHKAFVLLACFLRHPERVLSRGELLEEVWGYQFLGDSNVIEVTVGHVRQALEAAGEPRLIHTVRSVGYILRADNGSRRCG